MKLLIEKGFPLINQNACLEILNDTEFSVYDSESGRCFIQKNKEGLIHFTVKNPNKKDIGFLAIDKCIYMDKDNIERCDFAVFDNKTFCFIEIKETARRKSENSKKARSQLLTTIQEFIKLIDFGSIRLEAYVVVGLDFSEVKPASKAQDLTTTLEFMEYGVTLFHDGNEKKFK